MEGVTEFIGALIIALIVASIFYYGLGRRSPWAFWAFLLILFFAAWAGSFWIEPIGPVIWGFAWLPLFFLVLITALIIAAASGDRTTSRYGRTIEAGKTEKEISKAEAGTVAALGIFFWVLLGLFIIVILIGLLT